MVYELYHHQRKYVYSFKNGEEIKFNVFSATLGYSREHVFIFSSSKTEDDFKTCIIETFRRLGGVTQTVLTDNMSAIISIKDGKQKVHTDINPKAIYLLIV